MEFITVTKENLAKEHICCAISSNKDIQVSSKKAWLAERFDDGLVFTKADARGKCFIEYIPAEKAWAPIEAPGYMFIDCFWVAGSLKGQGYAGQLLDGCIADCRAKGKRGLAVISSAKKRAFLSDGDFLRRRGFLTADFAEPFFELLYLPLDGEAGKPRFREQAKPAAIKEPGLVLCYTNQCPYTAKYVPLIEEAAAARGVPLKAVRFTTAQEAQNAPSVFTMYSLFYDGKLVTHEILSVPKFEKLLDGLGL